MKSRNNHRRNRSKSRSYSQRLRLGELLEPRVLLAAEGLSAPVRAAFEQFSDVYEQYTRGEIRDATQWVVLMSDGSSGQDLATSLASSLDELQPAEVIPNTFIVDTNVIGRTATVSPGTGGLPLPATPEEIIAKLKSVGGIEYFYPLVPINYQADLIPNDDLFGDQWHLRNTGQSGGSPGADANVVDAWDSYTGAGVVIGVIDDGVEIGHPDLEDRIVDGLSYDFIDDDEDPSPEDDNSAHGTAVAGVAAATAFNLVGGVGMAFNAGLAGLRFLGGPTTDLVTSQALSHLPDWIDIYNNSWGPGVRAALGGGGPLTLATLERQVAQPRGSGGVGSIFVFAAGNDNQFGDDVNYNSLANSRFTIAVAAVGDSGVQSSYSNPGASLLVAGHSSDDFSAITTTDLTGDAGYAEEDYTDTFGGTSSAAPLVSGGIALMLEANAQLGYRDVQHILVESAAMTDQFDADWVTNGAGLHVNHKYGFGAFDALAAVQLAASWVNVGEEVSIQSNSTQAIKTIPDNDARGISSTIIVNDEVSVEWVEVIPNINHTIRGDLDVILTSPSGTESVLARQHGKQDAGGYTSWTFTTARNWGETSLGEWTLTVRDRAAGGTGTLDSWQMIVHGTGVDRPPVVGGSVSGFKWNDLNANGVRDPLEVGLANWRIYADLNNDGFLNPGEPSTFTDAAGNYTLANVPTGTQAIREQQKVGWEQTFPGASGAHTVSILVGATVSNINFGNRLRPGKITGIKWNDVNANGLRDKGELGVAGIQIYLDTNRNGVLDQGERSVRTDSNGRYTFGELASGIYQVREVAIPGVPQTFPLQRFHTVDVGQGESFDRDFGNVFDSASVYGAAWIDADSDAFIDANEQPVVGLVVYVDQNNDGRIGYGEPAMLTDAQGKYRFTGLATGNPVIRAVVHPGLFPISPTSGGYLTAIRPGSAAVNLDFGFGVQRDFGDAPAPYPTLLSENGPVHPIESGFFLGANVDAELDGVHSAGADADDTSVTDDENGIQFVTPLTAAQTARVDVSASKQGYLQAWIDFNADGDWLDDGEQIFRDQLVSAGLSRLVFQVPGYAVDGSSVARFRFAHEAGLSFTGPAMSGEVEDYVVSLVNETIDVTPAVANDDLFTVNRNSSNNLLAVLANDALGGVGLTLDAIGVPSRSGTVTLAADGRRLVYSPAPGFVGVETFNYVVKNAKGETDPGLVTVTVRDVAVPVDAINDAFAVDQNTVNNALNVLANDTLGAGGRTITAVGATNRGGSVTIAAGAQSLSYSPVTGFVGTETFTYTIRDSAGSTDTASVTITVRAVTLANAANDTATVLQNSTNNTLNVLANDSSDSAFTISAVGSPNAGGTVTIAADKRTLVYSPAADFVGTETFTYSIVDLEGDSDQATVTVTVQLPSGVDATNDQFTVVGNTTRHVFNVLANDVLTGAGALTLAAVGTPSNGGTVSIVSSGSRLEYTPANGFVGTETFTYTVSNGAAESDSALVTVTVTPAQTKTIRVRLETTTGAGIPVTSVNLGGTFQLRAYVQDLRAGAEGVFSAFLDVLYDAQLVTATGTINHGTIFTTGVGGTLATEGVIDEAGGISNPQSGDGTENLLFFVNFTADASGTVNFLTDPADIHPLHDILLFGTSSAVADAQVDYRSTSIEILDFTNVANALDVNGDNFVSAIDALLVINEINSRGARSVSGFMAADERPKGFVDVNRDGFVSAIDALLVINYLNQLSSPAAKAAIPAASADLALSDQQSFARKSRVEGTSDVDSVDLFADEVSRVG